MARLFKIAGRLMLVALTLTAGLYGVHRGQLDEKFMFGFERFIRIHLLNDPV